MIDIISVSCTGEGVRVVALLSGIEHDSEELTLTLRILQLSVALDVTEVTIPASAPNPAQVFESFTIPPSGIVAGQAVLQVFADDGCRRRTYICTRMLSMR